MKTSPINSCLNFIRSALIGSMTLMLVPLFVNGSPFDESFLQDRQSRQVSGTVSTSGGETLPGVSVIVKGTSSGTVTDVDGKYTINVPDNGTLVFSSIGYLLQEVPVSGRSVIDITLEEDIQSLQATSQHLTLDRWREEDASVGELPGP